MVSLVILLRVVDIRMNCVCGSLSSGICYVYLWFGLL